MPQSPSNISATARVFTTPIGHVGPLTPSAYLAIGLGIGIPLVVFGLIVTTVIVLICHVRKKRAQQLLRDNHDPFAIVLPPLSGANYPNLRVPEPLQMPQYSVPLSTPPTASQEFPIARCARPVI